MPSDPPAGGKFRRAAAAREGEKNKEDANRSDLPHEAILSVQSDTPAGTISELTLFPGASDAMIDGNSRKRETRLELATLSLGS